MLDVVLDTDVASLLQKDRAPAWVDRQIVGRRVWMSFVGVGELWKWAEVRTTGEAAVLLGSSRQHVVDLCQRGALSFTTTGTHRRVRRGDVEAIRDRTQSLTRDQRRSLWLAYAVAAHIVEDPPAAVSEARTNLARMRKAVRGQARLWLDEWERLLDGPVDELLDTLTSRSPRARELRQNSPFAGLLGAEERLRVLGAGRASEDAGRR